VVYLTVAQSLKMFVRIRNAFAKEIDEIEHNLALYRKNFSTQLAEQLNKEDITFFINKLITKANLRLKQRAPYFGDDPEYVTSHINRKIYAHWLFLAHAPNNMSEFAYVSIVLGHNGRHPLVTAAYTTVGFQLCELTIARLRTQIAALECVLPNALE
jgi:hypothetical protein